MKFLIIDDRPGTVAILADLIRSQRHEVFALAFARAEGCMPNMLRKFDLTTQEALVAAKAIREFDPDFAFVDHDLGVEEVTGEEVIRLSGIPKPRCIGTSKMFDAQRSYCGIRAGFQKDDLDVPIWTEREHPKFLAWLKAFVDKTPH
jgi:hypothetical protein